MPEVTWGPRGSVLGVPEVTWGTRGGVPGDPVGTLGNLPSAPGDPPADPWGPPRALLGTSRVSLETLLGTLGDLLDTSWAPWDPVGVSLGVSLGVQEVKTLKKPWFFEGFWCTPGVRNSAQTNAGSDHLGASFYL